jgi:hypothetical protein
MLVKSICKYLMMRLFMQRTDMSGSGTDDGVIATTTLDKPIRKFSFETD